MNNPKKNPRIISLLLLLILPALTVAAGQRLMTIAGPSWLGENLDPTYLYLMNSLNMANLHRPYYTDHPGTPIQSIGAVAIRGLNPTGSQTDRAQAVVRDPEKYVRLINGLLVLLTGLAVLVTGYIARSVFQSLPLALMIQATPFFSMTTLQGLTQLRPEPLLIGLAMLVVGIALLAIKSEEEKDQRYAIAFGVVIGFALSAKINFVPVAILPLVLIRSWKGRLIFCVTAGAAFVLSIFPILNRSLLTQMFGFIVNTAGHTGRYGSGQAGFIDPARYVAALVTLVKGDLIFFLLVVLSVLALLAQVKFKFIDRRSWRCLLGVTAAEIFQLLLVAKHPAARYLIPSLALLGLNAALLAAAVKTRLNQTGQWGAIAAVLLLFAIIQIPAAKNLIAQMTAEANRQLTAYEELNRDYPGVPVATYYTASAPAYALSFGAGYSGNLYGAIMQQTYPNQFFYNPWTGKFLNYLGPVDVATVTGSHPWFILRGCSLSDPDFKIFLPPNPIPDNVKIEPLRNTNIDRPGLVDCEAIYRATVQK